jgi:hypothetical protein
MRSTMEVSDQGSGKLYGFNRIRPRNTDWHPQTEDLAQCIVKFYLESVELAAGIASF